MEIGCSGESKDSSTGPGSFLTIIRANGMHKFQPTSLSTPTLRLIVYSNELCMRNGPLRTWLIKECTEFVQDVLDRYFPYELKEEFKDGVHIYCIDKHTIVWDEKNKRKMKSIMMSLSFKPFEGRGRRLDEDERDGSAVEDGTLVQQSSVETSKRTLNQRSTSSQVNPSLHSPSAS